MGGGGPQHCVDLYVRRVRPPRSALKIHSFAYNFHKRAKFLVQEHQFAILNAKQILLIYCHFHELHECKKIDCILK